MVKTKDHIGSDAFTREMSREQAEQTPERESKPEKSTALAKISDHLEFDYKKLGGALIERAEEGQRELAEKRAVGAVGSIMSDIRTQRRIITEAQEQIQRQEAKLRALQSGKFTIDPLNIAIHFTDESLNDGGGL
jgi:hypothetical protein